MTFVTKTISGGDAINIIQLEDKWYAKINYQPFDKYIIVCGIKFKTNKNDFVTDITIYNPYGSISDIIHEFVFLDKEGKDTLSKELKENLYRSVYYSQYESAQLPYFNDIGFSFGYH
jgi:hypothetical protein